MEAFSCTQPGRSVSLFSETHTVSVPSFKGRHSNVKCSASPRNANVNGGSVAETSRSPLRLFWFVKGGREHNNIGKQLDEDSNISLLNGTMDLNLRESLQEKSRIEEEDSYEHYGGTDSDDQDEEDPSFGVADGNRNGYFDEPSESDEGEGISSVERGNWVEKILEMRSFWKDKDNCKSAAVMEPLKNQGSSSSSSCSEDDHDGVCGCCYTDDRFLHRVSLSEIKFFAQLSQLCNMAYKIPNIKPNELLKNHHLRFITSSLEKKMEAAKKVKELAANDMSLVTSSGKNNSHGSEAKSKRRLTVSPAVAYEIAAAAASYLHSQTKYLLPFKSNQKNEHDVDENLKNETRQAGEEDKDCEAPGIKAVASNEEVAIEVTPGCEYKGALMNSSTHNEFSNEISSLSKSEVASFIATSSVTAVVAAEEETKQAVANDLQSIHSSPCEWFVCDEESTHTRLFVIQGSESFASWQANLFFESIQFEGLGVLVHRGIYEAAKGIYEQMLPEIHSHLKTHGEDARFRFTGHSLGGSLSVLVNLMLLIRGVLPVSLLLPVITFGSPCIMCGGDHLLKKLGLPTSHIQSVMMHRDIVPRAFSCHYPDHVAEILKRLNASFRNHPCLDNLRLLYAPMGQLLILQPDDQVSPPHHLLPSGSGLYILRHILNNESDNEPSREVQVRAAQMAFLNSPHPLETLSDPHAYGSDGCVLRDHDSRNYLRTLHNVMNQEKKLRRRLLRKQRRQMWWPLVVAESSMLVERSSKVNNTPHRSKTFVGAVSTIDSIQYTQAPGQFGVPLRVGIIFRRSKDTLRRFARLIASQHMHMGVLFLLSTRMLIVEVCTKFYS
ncbi:hypothetical protein SUGI_0100740 [Cryptomeria japonica]|nr:hypothetical protein SUGI_0100740 [Cryptomeria japonica]